LNVKKELFLAPIHEYTNYPFRELCKKYKAKYSLVPLVSSMGLISNKEYVEKVDYFDEKDVGIQLFGSDPVIIGKASEILIKKFHNLKWIDINSGCPSRNVIQSGGGSALLKHPKLVKEIIKEVKSRDVKVSVKMRLCNTDEKTFNFVKEIEPDFLIVHGRTVEQMYSGKANWEKIKEIKKKSNLDIVGNGDISNQLESKEKINEKMCDAVMIGRKAMSNPGCFSNKEISKKNKIEFVLEYLDILKEKEYYEKITLTRVKALNILKGFDNSSNVRKEVSLCKNVEEIVKILKNEGDFGCY
jgi:tRNA-dihydrouridine synthase B